jgi:hypothetical protein
MITRNTYECMVEQVTRYVIVVNGRNSLEAGQEAKEAFFRQRKHDLQPYEVDEPKVVTVERMDSHEAERINVIPAQVKKGTPRSSGC